MIANLDKLTTKNTNYREVVCTTKNLQVVLMSIPYKEEIGTEQHQDTTQFIRIEKGNGLAVLKNKAYKITTGDMVVIPPKVKHNIISLTKDGLKLYTIYSPPEHKKGLIQKTKPQTS